MLPLAGRGYDKQGGYSKPHIDGIPRAMGLTLRLRPLRKRREVLIRIPLTPAPHLDKTHSIL